MKISRLGSFVYALTAVATISLTSGCEGSKEPVAPASGSIQEFLDANPDYVEEVVDESEEDMTASSDE